ncbi:hypothetical protein [Mycetocola miduiensis]|uniref:Uncharacterized protein n=1 Tax=Mycetocola miduiensis TaxID=995034 RepID=A0A1I5E0G2_9MICO|nr:hypothetical protein [Mycetocola miduiensis]SFO04959.1 hypothetical protein SAMN05216219_3209 [Mycetocola miduiensis]
MMLLLILLLASVVYATIATVVELRRDGFRRLPERRFGPAGTENSDSFGRSLMAGMR